MLWSLLKIIIFVAIVAVLTLAAGALMETGPGLRIAFAGTEYTLGPLQTVIAAILVVAAIWLILKVAGFLVALVRFILGDDTALTRYWAQRNQRRGFEALSEGLLALSTGDGRVAMAKAAKAERLLHRPEITGLVTAQAAEMTGDRRKAEETYKMLLEDDRTRFVGVHGLMKQKLSEGKTDLALKLAERAFALKPSHNETADTLLKLQADAADWSGARKTLSAKLKHGSLPRDVHKRRDAVLALSEAKDVISEGATIQAKEAAIEANRLSPDLVPAAVMAARSYIADGKPRYATRVLRKAWDARPHPDLAAAYAEIEPDEDPKARIERFQNLFRLHPDHPETKMILAELYIAAEDFPAARKALGDLVETDPTARSLTLMAAVERGEGADDSIVRGWLTRALNAPRGPQWTCDNCQRIHSDWVPVCENCGSFDTLAWKVPPVEAVAMPKSTEMLPLIVGALEDKAAEPSPEPAAPPEPEVEDAVVEPAASDPEPAPEPTEEPPAAANEDSTPTPESEEETERNTAARA